IRCDQAESRFLPRSVRERDHVSTIAPTSPTAHGPANSVDSPAASMLTCTTGVLTPIDPGQPNTAVSSRRLPNVISQAHAASREGVVEFGDSPESPGTG